MAGIKRLLGVIIPFFAIFLMSQNAFADSATANVADVSFWSSAAGHQVTTNVNLPWQIRLGGSPSDRRSFYLNRINIWYPVTANVNAQNVWGRLVMRFQINATASEEPYFCDKKLSDFTGAVSNVPIECAGEVVYWFDDGTYYSSFSPVYFNYDLTNLNAFTDYSQALPNKKLTGITFKILKTGRYDVYSVLYGWDYVGTIKISDASFFINSQATTDINPLINQGNTQINQNNTMIDQNNTQINQNQQQINQNQQQINQDANYYNSNYQANDNISNQSAGDIQGSQNQQTTSLINVISGFISAFSGITAGNCNLTLEFPDYAGGTRVVNICSGKDKAPRIVEIGSSMLLICVFVPLAYIVIRMIYNEIRSWTNG